MKDEEEPNSVPVRKIIEKYNRMASIEKLSKLDIRDDKEKLYARLRSSRDELDTYIRHTKKIFEEKRFVERENAALKVQLANYDEKVLRLERLEQTLRFEFSRLWHLLKDPEFLKSKNVSEYTGIRDSISNILDPETVEKSNSFFDELDHVKQEIIEKQRIINQLDNEIAELNVKKSDALGSLKDLRNSATSSLNRDSRPSNITVPQTRASQDSQDQEDLKNQTKKLYLEHLNSLNELLANLETKRLCKIDCDGFPKIEKFSQVLIETPSKELQILAFTTEFMKILNSWNNHLMFQIEYLDKKAFEFYQANESLSEEVSQMKYALSHRLEMENYRKTLNKEPCGCAPEIAKLKEELNKAHDDLNNKEIELQAIYEQKFELIKIMAEMNDDTSESIDAITLAENEPEINIQHS